MIKINTARLDEMKIAGEKINAYIDFFYYYNKSPLLIVNTADFDLVNNADNYAMLLEQICYLKTGKHYFNPKEVA